MKYILSTTFLILACAAFGQTVDWGALESTKGRTSSVLPVEGSNFYTTRWSGGALMGSQYLGYHEHFSLVTSEKIEKQVPTGSGLIEKVVAFKSKVIVFLSDKKEGTNMLYMQVYDESCTPQGEAKLLAEYSYPKGFNKAGYFNVLQSQNQEYFCLEYSIPATREENERFGYKIVNANFETVSEGEYESQYEARQSDISNRFLTDAGDYYIAAKVYNVTTSGRVKDYNSLERVILMRVKPSGTEEMNLELADKKIFELALAENGKNLVCTGLYGADNKGVSGIFHVMIDFDAKDVTNESYNEFEKDFVTQYWTERQKKKADKREAKGKGEPTLYSYDIRSNITLTDGSMIGLMEQYYVIVRTTTTGTGTSRTTTTTYYYHYHDIIAYKITPTGDFEWVKKIPKHQVSADDGGYLSSFAEYCTDSKLVLLFNDNLKNYDEGGNFIEPDQYRDIEYAGYRKKTNCVAKVELDLATGVTTRSTFFGRAEAEAIAIPKLFYTDYTKNEMLMVLRMNKKEKFGLLKF